MNVHEFWWNHWKTIIDIPDWFLDKIIIAVKYDMDYEDFIKLVSNKYGCRFCGFEKDSL